MRTHWLTKAAALAIACLALGCGDGENKSVDPKLGKDQKVDPRIQRAVEPSKGGNATQLPGGQP